jgi:hypothetical protein
LLTKITSKLKKITLILILLLIKTVVFSQTNYYKLSLGAGAGGTLAFADLDKKTIGFAAYGTFDYHFTPYVTLGLEVQKGELAGGDILFDANNRQFINKYLTGSVNLKVQLGEFITAEQRYNRFLDVISGLYGGVGVGIIKNKISNVRYYDINYYPGEDASSESIMPINIGINFYLPDKWGYTRYAINVNLQGTIDFGEGLDGYTPTKEKNDMYSFLSVGFKYHFGFMGLDKRR